MRLIIFLAMLVAINCTGTKDIDISSKDIEKINLAINIIKTEVKGDNQYTICNRFVEISHEKLVCFNTEDLIERSNKINNKYLNNYSKKLSYLSTCDNCKEGYLISGFDEKYLFIEYLPSGYNKDTGCSTNYSYSELFLFNIETNTPQKLCSTGNSRGI